MCGFEAQWWLFPLMFLAMVILFATTRSWRGRWRRSSPWWCRSPEQERLEELEEEVHELREQLADERSMK
jgi:type VI protein secretion system component VasK